MNRRKHTRLKHGVPAQIRVGQTLDSVPEFAGRVLDISVMGLGMLLSGSPAEGLDEDCKARVCIVKADGKIVSARGTVVRSEEQSDGSRSIGIRFDRAYYELVATVTTHRKVYVDLDPYACIQINELLARYSSPGVAASA